MLRVSTRGRYALRAMVDLALHAGAGPVSRQDIAGRQGISADYVAQIFGALGEAGLVESVRGRSGGYRLTGDPATITAGDVVRAVEGPVAAVHCALPGDEPACERIGDCAAHPLWARLTQAMNELLDAVTLRDLCTEGTDLGLPGVSEGGGCAARDPARRTRPPIDAVSDHPHDKE